MDYKEKVIEKRQKENVSLSKYFEINLQTSTTH